MRGSSFRMLNARNAQNDARPIGVRAASEPPEIHISLRPLRMFQKASPMAWLADAHAVTMHIFGPFSPNSMEMQPLAAFPISFGTQKGDTLRRTFLKQPDVLIFDFLNAADAGSDDDADAMLVFFFNVQSTVFDGLNRGRKRHLRETVHPFSFAHIGVIFDIEMFCIRRRI